MHQRHRLNRRRRNAVIAVAGLMLGGTGLVAVDAGANATSADAQGSDDTISCPAVEKKLPDTPQTGCQRQRAPNLHRLRGQGDRPLPECRERTVAPEPFTASCTW